MDSSSENPQNQAQQNAQHHTRHYGKIKTEIPPVVVDVSRQPAQPVPAKTAPQDRSCDRQHHPGDHHEFAQVIHVGI
jgi:hypothetical protein